MGTNGVAVRTWEVPSSLSWEDWQSRMRDAAIFQKKWAWYLGDLLNYGVDHFGEKAWQFISNIKLAHETLMNYKSIAGKIPREERNAEVPFTVYQDIAALPRPERDRIVSGYLGGSLNRADIRALKTNGNGAGRDEPKDAQGGCSSGPPTAKELAEQEFGQAMAVCATLIRHHDDENLIEALDDLMAKAMVLRALLQGKQALQE